MATNDGDGVRDWTAMRVHPPSKLPKVVTGRLEFIHALMNSPVVDEDGNETGEFESLISDELAARLLEATA